MGLGSGECVDWWAVGVICYEFLYGIPPFHADTPDLVFENILSRRIDWHLDLEEFSSLSPEVHDFMDRLLCYDPDKRLGAKGAAEVKKHPFLKDVNWADVRKGEAAFIPANQDPENTDYFDPRGVTTQNFDDQEEVKSSDQRNSSSLAPAPILHKAQTDPLDNATKQFVGEAPQRPVPERKRSETAPAFAPFQEPAEDFGMFNFKNLDVLKQANQEVIRKLRSEQFHQPLSAVLLGNIGGKRSTSVSLDTRALLLDSPPPGSTASLSSTPSKGSWTSHSRRPSEMNSQKRNSPQSVPLELGPEQPHSRRNSLPSRLRSASYAFPGHEGHLPFGRSLLFDPDTPPSSVSSPSNKHALLPSALEEEPATIAQPVSTSVDVLIAEDNPISSKVLETILVRLGCRCVVVHNGEEVVRCTMGELVFDVIFVSFSCISMFKY